jgi:hypothetical protein
MNHWTLQHPRIVRALGITGYVAMILGAIDPLEGSVVVLFGISLVAWAAWLRFSRGRYRLTWAWGAAVAGVAAMWIMSASGGVGGSTGRSIWWVLVLLPYPIGWLVGLIEGLRLLREPAL